MDRNYAAASEDALLNSGSILDFIEDKASGFYSLLGSSTTSSSAGGGGTE